MRTLLMVATTLLLLLPIRTAAGVAPASSPGSKDHASASSSTGFAAKSAARAEAARQAPDLPPETRLASLQEGIQTYRAVQALGLGKRDDLYFLSGVGAAEELARLERANGEELLLRWRAGSGTPRLIQGRDLLPETILPADPVQAARVFLESNRHLLKVETPREEFALIRVERDADDRVAVRFQQVRNGLEVWGNDVLVRLSSEGRVTGFSGRYLPTPVLHQEKAIVAAGDAQRTAVQELANRDDVVATGQPGRLLLFPHEGDLRLAWRVEVSAGLAYRKEVFVDAVSGEFLHWVGLVAGDGPVTGSGVDLRGQTQTLNAFQIGSSFLLIDTTQPMFDPSGPLPNQGKGVIHQLNAQNGDGQQLFHVTSNNVNNWAGAANSVSCATFGQQVFQYFLTRHSRSSLDGKGMTMNMVVNFDTNLNNAFWSSPFMVFGNGDGSFFTDLAGSLDVTGHEMSHGVVEHTANLVYQFQSGALNEHFADVFGAAVEFFSEGAGADWLMGEDVTTPNVAGDGLRDLESPGGPKAAGGPQPAHMNQFLTLPIEQDNGGVHGNSGIPNKAFYEATEPASATGGIGILKTEKIWYRALTQYLTRSSDFDDFRAAIVQAATDLHGGGSPEVQKVTAALASVGLGNGGGGGGGGWDGTLCDNVGPGFLAVVDAGNGQIVRVNEAATEVVPLSPNAIGAGGRPSVSDDGTFLSWVASDGNVWVGGTNGNGAMAISNDGAWWSVAVSPDGSLLALTPAASEPNIYVVQSSSGNGVAFPLQTQSSQGGEVGNDIAYADVLEFGVIGDRLVYDALHRRQFNGQPVEFWDVNVLRLNDGISMRIFQSLPVGESVGNPTLAQNNDFVMAYDHLSSDGNIYIEAVNFQTGDSGLVSNNFDSLGRPTFVGDDSQIVYQYDQSDPEGIWVVNLVGNGLTGDGNDFLYLNGALAPVYFTVGQRCPTPILLTHFDGEWIGDTVELSWQVSGVETPTVFHVERRVGNGSFERRTHGPVATDPSAGEMIFRFRDAAPPAGRATYRLVQVDGGAEIELGTIEVAKDMSGLPRALALLPNYPNPFNPSTTLRFAIPTDLAGEAVTVSILDLRGRRVATLIDREPRSAGVHELPWRGLDQKGQGVAAGVYVVRVAAGKQVRTSHITMIK